MSPSQRNFFKLSFRIGVFWQRINATKMHQYENAILKRFLGRGALSPLGRGALSPSPYYFGHLSRKYNISVRTVQIYESLQHSQVHSNPSRDSNQKLIFI